MFRRFLVCVNDAGRGRRGLEGRFAGINYYMVIGTDGHYSVIASSDCNQHERLINMRNKCGTNTNGCKHWVE